MHRRPRALLTVGLGGAVGTLLRAGLDRLAGAEQLWSTVTVNVVGAFALGLLLELLARPPAVSRRAEQVHLLLGTGLLGGFTTYSTFALQVALTLPDRPALGLAHAAALLLAGCAAAGLGVVTAGALRSRRGPGRGDCR